MTQDFCSGFVDACSGQIDFPEENGQDYCTKHTGGGDDLYWSFPYTQREYNTLYEMKYTPRVISTKPYTPCGLY